ncbi:MAG: DNA mismatch repair protein MutS, partial [Thermacetogeniaceae bacterium]
MSTITPMMEQYLTIKKQYPDCLLFFRLGDFYELFGDDAEKAAKELQIVLTSREIGKNKRIPMCGVPYHAAESYLKKLLDSGYKVAICEQLEEPKPGKNLVKRDVVRVLTPGTVLDPIFLDQEKNNYILSLHLRKDAIGCAWCDISTGEFLMTQFSGRSREDYLADLINRLQPTECIIRNDQIPLLNPHIESWQNEGIHITPIINTLSRQEAIDSVYRQFEQSALIGVDRQALEEGLVAVGYLLSYIQDTQKTTELPFRSLSVFTLHSRMYLDAMTRKNLEIFTTLRDGKKEGSLLWALDRTLTPMGARLIRNWLEFPLLDIEEIQERQSGIEELINNFFLRNELKECLKDIYDLERIIGRIEWRIANPRDLIALAKSLEVIPRIKQALSSASSPSLQKLNKKLDPLKHTVELINQAISDDPPSNLKEGGIIKDNYHPEVDKLRAVIKQGTNWIKELEAKERQRTGIKSLKVGYNKVFGYYIEVTKPNLSLVPSDYIRKQTLTQAERFITPELKEREEAFLGATERLHELEYNLFLEIRQKVSEDSHTIKQNASVIAYLDCLLSFAEVALRYNYIKPVINKGTVIRIRNGRHPVLEQLVGEGNFIPNDLYIGQENNMIHLITGPNMAGKSTYMRQMALLILMAQCGSFIPAEEAEIGIVDRIFVRAGAMDDIGRVKRWPFRRRCSPSGATG